LIQNPSIFYHVHYWAVLSQANHFLPECFGAKRTKICFNTKKQKLALQLSHKCKGLPCDCCDSVEIVSTRHLMLW